MTTDNTVPKLVQDLIYAQEHRLLDNDVGRTVSRLMRCGVVDDLVSSLIQQPVRKHKIARAFAGPFELPKLREGDFSLGTDRHENPIRLPMRYLNGHSLTIGGSGSGKTTRSKFLILQVASGVKGLWAWDFEKREFGALKPHLAQLGVNFSVVRAREIRFNPLQCQDRVSPREWASRIADILVQTLQLPSRATKLLHLTVLQMYQQFGVLDGAEHYPTLFDLRETIARDPNANPQAKQAAVDSLDPVLMSIGDALRYCVGWKTSDLAKRHIVFELGGISETDKNLILNSLTLSEFASRVAGGVSNPKMDLWICCDEAARLVSATNQSKGIANLIGLVRGTGVGLDLSVQSADVDSAVFSNTANKFIGRCGSASDYDRIAASMGLTREQRNWLNINLRPGLFVGQVGEGDWRRPFVLEIPHVRLNSPPRVDALDDAEQSDLITLPTQRVDELTDWDRATSKNGRPPSASAEKESNGELSEVELRYIRAVVEHPGKPSSELPKLARTSSKRALRIRRYLVELGYLREHRVSTGLRGRAAVVLEPLEPALQAMRNITVEVAK